MGIEIIYKLTLKVQGNRVSIGFYINFSIIMEITFFISHLLKIISIWPNSGENETQKSLWSHNKFYNIYIR